MSCYIKIANQPTEVWLNNNAVATYYTVPNYYGIKPENILICLIKNGESVIAGVCEDEDAFRGFCDPTDPRDKTWFEIPRSLIV